MSKGAWAARAASGLLLLALAACNKPAPLVAEGRAFPAAMLDFLASGDAAGRSLDGKILVLNVWATWCQPCRREMPSLDRLSRILDPKRFAVIGLSTDRDGLLVAEFLLQNGITFANVLDPDAKQSRRLGMKVYPETFVIGPDRTLLRRMPGLHDWSSTATVGMLEALYRAPHARPDSE